MIDDPKIVIEDDPLDLPMDFDVVEAKKEESKTEVKVADKADGVEDEAIASLKRQLDEARAEAARQSERAIEAQRQAREFETRATNATTHTLASQIDSVESAIALAKSEGDQAQRSYAAAMEVADYDAAAKAQRVMSRAEAEVMRLQDGKAVLTDRQKKVSEQPQRREAPSGVDDMVDGIIQASSRQAQDYIRRNRAALTSEKHVNRMIAAHQLAVSSDVEPDTEDYFTFIDKQMGWGGEKEPEAPARKAQTKTVSAPVSRGGGVIGSHNGKPTISREAAELAKEMGVSPSRYYANVLKIQANGKDQNASGLRFSKDMT